MRRVVAIVEGYGDSAAVSTLIAKIGLHFCIQLIASNPIRVGEWQKLKRPGELERVLELAHGREWDHILILLDLDDDCAAAEALAANERIERWKNGRLVDVSLVFLIREYESLFLSCADSFSDDVALCTNAIASAEVERNAKGKLRSLTGKRYKETQDQVEYTKKIEVANLIERSRCFRKLAKELARRPYESL